MKKFLSLLLVLVVAIGCCFGMTACNNGADDGKIKVGLICLHGRESTYDKNFIEAFEAGCAAKGVELVIKTGVPESADCKTAAQDFANDGCDIIFADSFGHEPFLMEVAKEFPNVIFAHATGTKAHTENLANFDNAFASIYEGRFLAGIAGGMKLKEIEEAGGLDADNFNDAGAIKIGYVGAWTYAEVVSGYTSWYLGVKEGYKIMGGTKDIEMSVKFTGSWYDETAEKTTAQELINSGCALISQHADSMGAPTACEEAGIPNVSYNGSTAASCPDTFIVSSRINWQTYCEYLIDSAKNNKRRDVDFTGTIADNSVVLTELGAAAAEGTQAKIDEYKTKLQNGDVRVFDVTRFTVTIIPPSGAEGDFGTNTAAVVDANGHLTSYIADVDDFGDYIGETEVIKTDAEKGITYFAESEFRSAPYFDIKIDGIKLLNVKM